MSDHKNTILAIVLSLLVLVTWQYFIGFPQMEKQRQEAALKQQQQQSQVQPPGHAADRGQADRPGHGAAAAPRPGRRPDGRASSSRARPCWAPRRG